MREIEQFLGFLLTQQLEPILATADEVERISLETFHPSWFVNTALTYWGITMHWRFCEEASSTPKLCPH